MSSKNKPIKRFLEQTFHRKMIRFGSRHLLLANPKRPDELWFHYDTSVARLLTKLKVDLIIDVGGNAGQFGNLVRRKLQYHGPMLSFEPNPSVFAELSKSCAHDSQWTAHCMALGSTESTLPLNISSATVFSSFLQTNEYCLERFGDASATTQTVNVPVIRLDKFLESEGIDFRSHRIFLKMDTQGYDLEVFNGLGMVRNHIVLLQSEVSLLPIYEGMPHWTESIAYLEKEGFSVANLFPVNWDGDRVIEYDCLMINNNN